MKKDIHAVIDLLKSDPQGVSTKFGVPLRTVYSWCSGERIPPDYVIMMMLNIILLERRIAANGNTAERLENRMGSNIKTVKEVGKKS